MNLLKLVVSYIYLLLLCFEILAVIALVTYKLVKRHKEKKAELSKSEMLSEELKLSNEKVDSQKALNVLVNEIIPASIELAEKSGILSGELKKVVAMSDIMLKCSEAHIDWQKVSDFVSNKIEDLIDFSKKVNKKGH